MTGGGGVSTLIDMYTRLFLPSYHAYREVVKIIYGTVEFLWQLIVYACS